MKKILIYVLLVGLLAVFVGAYLRNKSRMIEYVPNPPKVVEEASEPLPFRCLSDEGIEIECKG